MIYTMATGQGVILKSDQQGYFKLQDPGIVACGRCGAGILTLLRTRHRETCKMEEDLPENQQKQQDTAETTPPPTPGAPEPPAVETAVPPAPSPESQAPTGPPRPPLILIPGLSRLPKPPGGKR